MIYVNNIEVCPGTVSLERGKWYHGLTASVYPSNATKKSVTWHSSNANVASVNATAGYVSANAVGTATIYATAIDGSGVCGSCSVTVTAPVCVEEITLNKSALELWKGNTYRLSATVCPDNASNKAITWNSSKETVASVSANGLVTAKSAGMAVIYATAQDGSEVHASCIVRVQQTVCCCDGECPNNEDTEGEVADPIDVYSGAHKLQNSIMTLFGGQGLQLTAHYNSTHLAVGDLGSGWYHNYEKHLELSGRVALLYISPSIYSKYVATSDCCTEYACSSANKNGYVLTVDHSRQYPYIINCNADHTEYYNANGDLAKIVDHQGFATLIDYTDTLITITDTVSGKKIYLEKDANCRVCRVYDDASRQATLTYEKGLLVRICDVNGNALSYTYDNKGRIKTGTDSKGTCYFENTYDEYGRVKEQKDAITGSRVSTIVYEDDGKRTTTDRNGKQSTRIFNSDGLLTSYTDENGNTKTYTYDSRFNIIQETDAKGKSVKKVYNAFNKPTEITDKNGNKTYITYDNAGNVVRILYPAIGNITPQETFVYNSRNQLTQHADRRGTVTVYTYDTAAMPATKKVGSKNAVQFSYENGLLVSETDAMGNTTQFGHNAIGQVTSKKDANNNVTTYTYDLSGNLLSATDANGKTVATTYDGNYQKSSVTDANGNKTEYSYNGNMKNDVVTLPDGNRIRYEFDGEDRPVKITDQANKVTTIQYDDAGRVVSKHFPDGGTVQYVYDKVGNVEKEINPMEAVTTKEYDGNGNVVKVTDHEGNVIRYTYNAMSKVVRAVNAVSGATTYTYSAAGDLLTETNALGHSKVYTYDAFGNKLTFTDAKGNTTTYTYDANNNLLTVKDPLNNVTTYTYNCLNQLVSVKDAKNNVVRYGYDALGRRTTITDAKNNVFTTVYDANGNVIRTQDAKGTTVSQTVYNNLNLPATVTDAMGKTTTYTYNALGKVEVVTDALNQRREYIYNSRGQNTAVLNAVNNIGSATYDILGNVTRLEGPLGGATNYTYDAMGRLVTESTASGGTKRYEYNELNIRKKLTNARGQVRQFFYDAMGRITGCTFPEGTVSYTYDANGNVLTVTDDNGTITRTYDALNRVTSYTDTYGKVIRYEYDEVGNLTKMTYPDNTAVNYAYDANHNLVRVTDWANRVTTYTYDVNNKVVGVTKPDGSVTTTVYDLQQRITSTVERTASGAVITGFEYTYDSLSRVTEEKHLANNTKMCYMYDELSRVTKRTIRNLSSNAVLSEENYTYDAAGNVTGSCGNTAFTYDINNRLTAYNGDAVSYDQDGNMLSAPIDCLTTAFTYDSANRLVSAGCHAYTYNAEDVRIRNNCGDYNTTYTYNTVGKLSQLLLKNTNGNVTKYVYGLGLIGEEKQGSFKTYHFDYRGSTVAITDASGNITDTFQYDTYGKLISRTGTSFVIFGYNGRDGVVTDKNGLIYMRARYYAPELRRFVNADIIPGEISNAVTLNRYAYANGNPVTNVDPFGLCSRDGGNNNLFGAAYKEKISIVTIDEQFDLTLGLNLVKIAYTQTVSNVSVSGSEGDLAGVYAFLDKHPNLFDSSVGVGVDLFSVLNVEASLELLGAGVTLSGGTDECSFYVNLEVDLLSDSTASVGMVTNAPNGEEINDQIAIKGNTYLVLYVLYSLLTGAPVTDPATTTNNPGGYPQPAPA